LIDGVEVGRYSYDWQLQRVSRTAGGSTVEYVLDDKLVLQELDGSHASTRRYHFGALSPLGVSDSAGPRWLLNDGLGSVSDEVTPSGGLFKQRQYNAWGEYRNSTAPALNEPKLGYEGHQYDNETSLTYARARYLDNRYGVLLSRDAVEGALNDAPSLHRYAWARGGPVRFTDFSGNRTDFAAEVGEDLRQQRAEKVAADEARRQRETGGLPEFDAKEAEQRNWKAKHIEFLNADLSKAPRHIRQQQEQARQLEFLLGVTMEGSKLAVEGAVVYLGGEVVGIMVGGVLRPLGTALERDLAAGGRAVVEEGEGAAGAVLRPKVEVPGGVGGGKVPPGGGGAVPPGQGVPGGPLVKATDSKTLNLTRDADISGVGGSGDDVIYVLRDTNSGELLKVGKSEVQTMGERFKPYVRAGERTERELAVDVFTVKSEGRTAESIEKEVRAHLEGQGHKLPWDNTGNRLGRPGPGVPGAPIPRALRDKYEWEYSTETLIEKSQ
ncbi:MAG: hypothetical protein JNK82_23090, partial [Myxococcaceae bacterium]|nr:hypothetical protein [Myxococcaceae bacterium]